MAEKLGVRIENRKPMTDYFSAGHRLQTRLSAKETRVRYLRYWLLMLLLVSVALTIVACREEIRAEPLLLLEDGDDAEELAAPSGPVADNSRCYVCHINYEEEALTFVHARADIGCEQCHGSSDAHCSDEDNITPPDIMYPAAKIDSFCMSCHPKGKIDVPVHKSVLADIGTEEGGCTNCHGEHRLSHRTRKWDKTTGKLLEDDKVRMLTDEMLEK